SPPQPSASRVGEPTTSKPSHVAPIATPSATAMLSAWIVYSSVPMCSASSSSGSGTTISSETTSYHQLAVPSINGSSALKSNTSSSIVTCASVILTGLLTLTFIKARLEVHGSAPGS